MYKAAIIFALITLVSVPSSAAQIVGFAEAPDPLEDATWNNRLLIVCEESRGQGDPPIISAQYDEASWDWGGYLDRKLILVWLTPDDAMSWNPVPNPDPNKVATLMMRFHAEDKTQLIPRTDCVTGRSHVSLIGLDGEIKRVWEDAVSNDDLFALIDAMPMRAEELRRSGVQ